MEYTIRKNKRFGTVIIKCLNTKTANIFLTAPSMYELLKEIRNADLEMSQAMEATIEIALAKADGKS